jgi:hypothetical protein
LKLNFYELLPKHPIKPEIKALIEREGPVSLEEYRALRMNSYDREALIPKLSDEALLWDIEYALENVGHQRSPPETYNEAIIGQYMPEMVKRFRRGMRDGK